MLREFRRPEKLMGNAFEITVVSDDGEAAMLHTDAAIQEIRRIEKLLTTFNEESETNRINRNAGLYPVKTDPEVFDLIERSLRISSVTDCLVLKKLYSFLLLILILLYSYFPVILIKLYRVIA